MLFLKRLLGGRQHDWPMLEASAFRFRDIYFVTVRGKIGLATDDSALRKTLHRLQNDHNWTTLRVDFSAVRPVADQFDSVLAAYVCGFLRYAHERRAVCEVWFDSPERVVLILSLYHLWRGVKPPFHFYHTNGNQLIITPTNLLIAP